MIGFFNMAIRRWRRSGERRGAQAAPKWRTWWLLAEAVGGLVMVITFATESENLPSWLAGTLMIVGAVALADAMLPLARKVFPLDTCERNANLVGGSLAIVGTIYAIIVGFAVVVVWEQHSEAEATVAHEANALADLERMSHGFPVEVRRQVHEAERTYLRLVVDEEWRNMEQGASSVRAHAALVELWAVYTDMSRTERSDPLYEQSLVRLNEISDNRRLRLLAAADRVPTLMWLLVYLGALATLVLCYSFGIGRGAQARIILLILSGTIGFSIFLIASLDGPFSGDFKVEPEAFVFVLENMAQLEE
ncbi:MAG: DUF4239 domain-containing protein [Stackebrandtia sp.]